MAAKKSQVASKKSKITIKWWMVLIGVAAVAIVGIGVLRYSQAGQSYTKLYQDTVEVVGGVLSPEGGTSRLELKSSGQWYKIGLFSNGTIKWQRANPTNLGGLGGRPDGVCATIAPVDSSNSWGTGRLDYLRDRSLRFTQGMVVTVGEVQSCQ